METTGTTGKARIEAGLRQMGRMGLSSRVGGQFATLGMILTILAVWEGLSRLGVISRIIFPPPLVIITTFLNGIVNGRYFTEATVTFSRILSGFFIGGSAALIIGMIMGWSQTVRRIFDPIVALLHPIPKFALLPMIIILFGIGESSRIAMVSISAFFPMLISTMVGVMQVNPTYYEVAENYGASKLDVFRKVVLPGSLPFIMSGIRLSLKSSLTVTIGVEMVFGNSGLGRLLWLSWETLRMEDMYSVLIIVSGTGYGIIWILEILKKIIIPWHHDIRPTD